MKSNFPLKIGAKVGILGGGQLGRMLALAAARLGFKVHIYCPETPCPAAEVAAHHTIADYSDDIALQNFAQEVDVITYEFENIPVEPLKQIVNETPIFPGINALEITQDRLVEKQYLQQHSISVAQHMEISSQEDLEKAIEQIGYPSILKTRRFGYDGKGQKKLNSAKDLADIEINFSANPSILERIIPFERELSIIMARNLNGEVTCYDLAHNIHSQQILKETNIPAPINDEVTAKAKEIATKFAESINYIGVFAIEFFHVKENNSDILIVNEIAPRVHNSGHWTMDATICCQFENHIRAIVGWPLGSSERHSNARMTNLVGNEIDEIDKWLTDSRCVVHLYGKKEARSGRKMGHVTKVIKK